MRASEAILYGGLAYGVYWLLSRGRGEAAARARQENVVMPKITPMGDTPRRGVDNPLTDDERAAIANGIARLDESGWLTYTATRSSSSGGTTW